MGVGHIYLIMNTNFEYKIGMTKKSVSDRVKQLQTGNSGELKIISYYEVKNYDKVEKSLHNFFSYKRIRGEWFNLNEEEILNFEKTVRGFEKAISDYNYGKDNILI